MDRRKALRRPHPRTAHDRSRLIVTTLLLLGGAFVLGLTWFTRDYRIRLDRTSHLVPDSALMAVTVPFSEGAGSVLSGIKGRLGTALGTLRLEEGDMVTVFVDRDVDNGELGWHVMTDGIIDHESLPKDLQAGRFGDVQVISTHEGRPFSVSRDHKPRPTVFKVGEGRGWVMPDLIGGNESERTPLKLTLEEGGLRLVVGKRFTGLITRHVQPKERPEIMHLPSSIEAYAYLPGGHTLVLPTGFEAESPFLEAISVSGAHAELLRTADDRFTVLLHGDTSNALKVEALEQPIIEHLRYIQPKEVPHRLPDGSLMTELRSNEAEVELEERLLPHDLHLKTFRSADDREITFIYYPDGRTWITTSPIMVSGLLMSGEEPHPTSRSCTPNALHPGGFMTGDGFESVPGLPASLQVFTSLFKAGSYRIEDVELGLFTFCGYF